MKKLMLEVILLISLLNLINCSPIDQFKTCNIDNNTDDFNIELLEGDWYDIVRTKNIYNEKTWKNGFTSVVVDKLLKQIEFNFSGMDNLNECQFFNQVRLNYTTNSKDLFSQEYQIGTLKVLNYSDNTVILAICFNKTMNQFCDPNSIELFVWSRNRINSSDSINQYKSLLNQYCIIKSINELVYSDLIIDICLNKNVVLSEEDNDYQFIAIAELTSLHNLTALVNKTNTIEIDIDLNTKKANQTNSTFKSILKVENNSSLTTNSTQNVTMKPLVILTNLQNLTIVPVSSHKPENKVEIYDDTLIESDDKDIMVIGLRKNNLDSKFDPVYVEIELGSGESELKVTLPEVTTSSLPSEIGLKKQQIKTNELDTLGDDESADTNEELTTNEDVLETIDDKDSLKENTTDTIDYEVNEQKKSKQIESTTTSDDSIEDAVITNMEENTSTDEEEIEKEEGKMESNDILKSTPIETVTLSTEDDTSLEKDSEEIKTQEINAENEIISNSTSDESSQELKTNQVEEKIITEATTAETTTEEVTPALNNCPENQCHVTVCNHGHKKDENNCPTCDCLKNPNNTTDECSPPYCHPCFYGSFTDVNGCESCACKPRPKPKNVYECPKLDCVSCNYGSIKDEYGCETCICIRPNSLEPSYQCSAIPVCPYGECKHGSVLNDFGCPTCDCLKSVEPDRDECVKERCQPCQHGYFTDSEGCETCLCKPEWMAPCGQIEVTCDLNKFKHGTYLDRNGCPSCECLPDPAASAMSCFEMQESNGQTECNNDGTFKSKQCNDQECRCVTKDGIPISDFKALIHEAQHMNCECALALYDVSAFKAVGFKLYCASNGNYETIQCVGSSCACVNEHGDPLGPSVPIYQKHFLRCEGVFQRVYYDQYLTTIAPTTLTPPLCVYHRERAEEMSNIDAHIAIPFCDEKGLYEPLQCDRQKKYCWCVNVHNGVELNGSRKTGQEPDCSFLSG